MKKCFKQQNQWGIHLHSSVCLKPWVFPRGIEVLFSCQVWNCWALFGCLRIRSNRPSGAKGNWGLSHPRKIEWEPKLLKPWGLKQGSQNHYVEVVVISERLCVQGHYTKMPGGGGLDPAHAGKWSNARAKSWYIFCLFVLFFPFGWIPGFSFRAFVDFGTFFLGKEHTLPISLVKSQLFRFWT